MRVFFFVCVCVCLCVVSIFLFVLLRFSWGGEKVCRLCVWLLLLLFFVKYRIREKRAVKNVTVCLKKRLKKVPEEFLEMVHEVKDPDLTHTPPGAQRGSRVSSTGVKNSRSSNTRLRVYGFVGKKHSWTDCNNIATRRKNRKKVSEFFTVHTFYGYGVLSTVD